MSTQRTRQDAGYCNAKKLPKGSDGRNLCRYCQVEVPKSRRTFCSDYCVHEWKIRTNPGYLRAVVEQRDKGICAGCGTDCEALLRTINQMAGEVRKPLLTGQERLQADRNLKSLLEELKLRGFRVSPSTRCSPPTSLWDADHIIPVAEGGGQCGLENIQVLCHPCHRAATAALRKRLAQQKKQLAIAQP